MYGSLSEQSNLSKVDKDISSQSLKWSINNILRGAFPIYQLGQTDTHQLFDALDRKYNGIGCMKLKSISQRLSCWFTLSYICYATKMVDTQLLLVHLKNYLKYCANYLTTTFIDVFVFPTSFRHILHNKQNNK